MCCGRPHVRGGVESGVHSREGPETDINLIAVFEECIYVDLGQDGRFFNR